MRKKYLPVQRKNRCMASVQRLKKGVRGKLLNLSRPQTYPAAEKW